MTTVGVSQDSFDWEAEQYAFFYETLNENQLLNRIRKRKWDPTFQIWNHIARIGTKENAAPVLLKVLKRYWVPTAHRQKAIDALFAITGIKDRELHRQVSTWISHPLSPRRKATFRRLRSLIES